MVGHAALESPETFPESNVEVHHFVLRWHATKTNSGNLRKKELCWKDRGKVLEPKSGGRNRLGEEQKADVSRNPGRKTLLSSASVMSQVQLQLCSTQVLK